MDTTLKLFRMGEGGKNAPLPCNFYKRRNKPQKLFEF